MQKSQQWEAASEADCGIAVEREAIIRSLAERDQLSTYDVVPSSNAKLRRLRRSRSLKLWTALMRTLQEFEGLGLEKASQRWPIPLQRCFSSALRRRKQERWPCTPTKATRFVRDLRTVMPLLSAI